MGEMQQDFSLVSTQMDEMQQDFSLVSTQMDEMQRYFSLVSTQMDEMQQDFSLVFVQLGGKLKKQCSLVVSHILLQTQALLVTSDLSKCTNTHRLRSINNLNFLHACFK